MGADRAVLRVMLDTNLWSSIGDELVADEFDRLMASRSMQVLVAPSTLVEVVQLPAPEARRRIIHALAKGPRKRLCTEAESESADVVAEIRRARPEWMRDMADTARVASLNNFWTNRIWRSAVSDSEGFHQRQVRETAKREHLVTLNKNQRKLLLQEQFDLRPLTAITIEASPEAPERYLDGWSGRPVEAWRINSRDYYRYQLFEVAGRALLSGEDTTCADWIGACVNLARLRSDRRDFTRFWLEEVRLAALPREWIRWAVRLVQSDYKVTRGNPADEQHSSYLVECDLFLSADARYVSILANVRADAPFPMAEPRLVSGDREVPIITRLAAAL